MLKLKRPWSDGAVALVFEPEVFVERLAALVLDRLFSRMGSPDRHPPEGLMSRQRWYYRSLGRLVEVGGRLVIRVSASRRVSQRWAVYAPELLRSS